MKVKPVTILGPVGDLFGLVVPSCFNAVSAESDIAYLVCPDGEYGPDIISVDPETWEHRKQIVRLLVEESGLYATPCFAEDSIGRWIFGGSYILVPVKEAKCRGCGYEFYINNTAVPLYDFWDKPMEPTVISVSLDLCDDEELPY